jgi:hypothetical protein
VISAAINSIKNRQQNGDGMDVDAAFPCANQLGLPVVLPNRYSVRRPYTGHVPTPVPTQGFSGAISFLTVKRLLFLGALPPCRREV